MYSNVIQNLIKLFSNMSGVVQWPTQLLCLLLGLSACPHSLFFGNSYTVAGSTTTWPACQNVSISEDVTNHTAYTSLVDPLSRGWINFADMSVNVTSNANMTISLPIWPASRPVQWPLLVRPLFCRLPRYRWVQLLIYRVRLTFHRRHHKILRTLQRQVHHLIWWVQLIFLRRHHKHLRILQRQVHHLIWWVQLMFLRLHFKGEPQWRVKRRLCRV